MKLVDWILTSWHIIKILEHTFAPNMSSTDPIFKPDPQNLPRYFWRRLGIEMGLTDGIKARTIAYCS